MAPVCAVGTEGQHSHQATQRGRVAGSPGRRLHSVQGGEFKSTSVKEICQWKGIVHTFADRAQHLSNGLLESKTSQLNDSVRSTLLASDLAAYLWPKVYMAMCNTRNMVPSSALQRELKRKQKQQEADVVQQQDQENDTILTPH